MPKKIILFIAGFLFFLNVFCWQEVFILADNNNLKVDFLDVGQGDSAFIETPGLHKILIDGGPSSAVLQKLAERLPFFDLTIDVVILTHPEKDHMSGILDVLQKYNVNYFLWTGVAKNNAEDKKLAEILNNVQNKNQNFLAAITGQKSTKVMTISAGEKIKSNDFFIDILFPLENLAGKEIKNTSNDTGIVSKLVFGKNSFLFTADISSKAEKEIVNSGENILSDVLKVAHHGSKYSTSDIFLAAVKPKIAVISVGAKNKYGHPTPETLQRLQNFGIKILRTDQSGDVNMESDGKNIMLK